MGRISFKTDTNNKAKLHPQDTIDIEREWELLAAGEVLTTKQLKQTKSHQRGYLPND